ncbi:hypothetical protein LEMLEM_LOCUS16151 [Lemmus lemmus]
MTGWGQQLLTFNSWKHEGLNSQEERHCGQTEADSPSPSPSCSSSFHRTPLGIIFCQADNC